ncbi:hypothetical protein CXG81DRAFT_28705 [Caulochytrium protostelioides]|uniref:TLC domain-containing protein n=1 Tax=Caulochytrium protostelioides TaxID=1555241 RepID=A0A4P9X0P9_9FUNG|nr:hypothetical protein CXG81DRAFT_28705 [Caulochytrium protostelioides]|eukprot:RKO98465.1 hypothetical protein CXG81DRAFT_28705 [Caulochytrium protostelioides]
MLTHDTPTLWETITNTAPGTGMATKHYGKDAAIYVFFVALFVIIRQRIMYTDVPKLARYYGLSIQANAKVYSSFLEQVYLAIAHTIEFSVGAYLLWSAPYGGAFWARPTAMVKMWDTYPPQAYTTGLKVYYLGILAYWTHLALVMVVEDLQSARDRRQQAAVTTKQQQQVSAAAAAATAATAPVPAQRYIPPRRNDYAELCLHHVVTLSLIACSYVMNFLYVGHVIMALLDTADIVLAMAKTAKYVRKNKAADVLFGMFAVSWILTRHVFFGAIIWSVYNAPSVIPLPHVWDTSVGRFYSWNVYYGFMGLLLTLQALLIFWLVLILRVVFRVLFVGEKAEDTRENFDEDEDEISEADTSAHADAKGRRDVRPVDVDTDALLRRRLTRTDSGKDVKP